MSGDASLRAMIAKLRQVRGLVEQSAPEVAAVLCESIDEQIASGVDPQGAAWKRTQQGTQPLRRASGALAVTHHGTTIFVRLRGPEARHNNGTARGRVERRILPKAGFAKGVEEKIRDVLTREFKQAVGRG